MDPRLNFGSRARKSAGVGLAPRNIDRLRIFTVRACLTRMYPGFPVGTRSLTKLQKKKGSLAEMRIGNGIVCCAEYRMETGCRTRSFAAKYVPERGRI